MAVIKKTLFAKNLDKFAVLVNDTQPDSEYFKITELPDTFTGGKNAFLIAGSSQLVPDTRIQIELKDSSGNIIYHEPGEGMLSSSVLGESFITEYYEGVSKVVSVYVYPDTAYGPCTLTILGELSEYNDSNGLLSPVPLDWENKYNVKWQKQIDVNPSLANTTKIRFYKRPIVTISELLEPIYRIQNGLKVNTGINQSFANIKISNLETFAGDVKRVKVFRTSLGDISDFDLIQDILVESKELLTTFGLSGSVVGNTGIFTSETLKNFWNTGSLTAYLTSSRVESGVALNGSGYFTHSSSLDIKSANTYELNLDSFYSASTDSNLGIYLSQVTTSTDGVTPLVISSSIVTLIGTQPTKNLLDTVIPFKIDRNFPDAKLYFSQSQGEWHLGNISLRLSQDTAFSPDEISFITTMPTVVGNEDFNFKFEFYDVNNNFVPVLVTGSLNFTGGTSPETALISASLSQSLAAIAAVSTSISGTMTVYSQSADTTITNVSSSTNTTITNVSSSISSSIFILSGSVSSSLTLTSGSITLVSSSLVFTSQSLNSSLTTLSSSISTSLAFNVSQSAFQVFSASEYLDKFIFTDENGKINQPPTASSPGLYLGSDHLGYFSGSDWKTYMDNQGDFYLTSSIIGGGFLAWDSSTATLQVQGAINIQGGNAATTSSLNSATASLSSSLSQNIFTDATGKINRPPTVLVNSSEGLFLGSTNLGYYSGSDWKTYMDNQGDFYLSGPGSNSLSWVNGQLSVNGSINVTGGNAATTTNVSNAQATAISTAASDATTKANTAQATAISTAANDATTKANSAQTSAELFATSAAGRAVTSGSNAATTAQTTAINQAKADASASVNLLANGGWTAGTGTFITARSISSPVLAGNAGYISEILRVGENGITLDGGNKKIFVGTGTYSNANTPFFFASGSTNIFSLGNKLSWDGTTLNIVGNLNVGSTVPNAAVTGLGALATQSNVSTGQVTGLGTLATRDNINLSFVTNAGSLAALSSISSAELDANAVTNAKIAADAVTEGKLAANAVTSGKISAGAIVAEKIAADAITADKISAGSITAVKIAAAAIVADKISAGAITAAKIEAGAIVADKIGANEINATKISSLSFSGKTATFDQGTVAGWTMDGTGLFKTTGNYTLRLGANAQRISITQTAANNIDTIDRVRIEASTSIPTIAVSDTGSLNWANNGAQMGTISGLSIPNYQHITTNYVLADGGSSQYGTGVFGIIGLQYAEEEIFVEAENFPLIGQTITGTASGFGMNDYAYGYWNCSIKVRKFPSDTDALNQTNVDTTFGINGVNEQLLAFREFRYGIGSQAEFNIDKEQVYGATIPVLGGGGINTPATAVWYRVEILQNWYIEASGGDIDTQVTAFRPFGDIFVKFGRVNNGYSVFSPGGLQVYQGVRNYMNASIPEGTSGDASNFFIVKGKSQIIGSLNINGGFSANNKQFKIEHPLNESKWLYHTSTEAPRADLIYRGILQLQNGEGSASIDFVSRMTTGTFHTLTKNPQLFLQNNESFDRIKGYVESGSVYVLSENQNSSASIDWSVIAERRDTEMLKSPLYDRNGNYKTENYKSEYLELTRPQRLINFSGSI